MNNPYVTLNSLSHQNYVTAYEMTIEVVPGL